MDIVAEYDTTGNFFWPSQGISLSGEYQFYGHYLGGDYRYDLMTQGEDVSTVQTQIAWQATPQWVIQGFVGAGSAADRASDIYRTAEVAWEIGFRYVIAKEYGLHSGIDIAFSDHKQAVYFNVGSGL